ncbi:uncharacterized protein E0L32_012165 [Thyridium curvatum]|uniref:PHD and RING finger domain-containing protein n=1 Tax=Thyridium curvatum TaxID=1093900 RepID=A0A507BL18_9PEZI|nr:uncharacterized protein E0L32_012165 [Thyridium curvatum]TPX17358.1 hypothetical protein E0L32_012165 [Thyridium curvatum]
MADQCIVCLDNLDTAGAVHPPLLPSGSSPDSAASEEPDTAPATVPSSTITATISTPKHHDNHDNVAIIEVCGHMLHDTCLREWTGKANSCPICRQSFHLVQVYDKVGGKLLSTYNVEDKKQVAEFDPQAWLDDNPEEEEEVTPCPVCNLADNEDVLLLCDGCDTPYHTYCIGLDGVPAGSWFCMECAELLGPDAQAPPPQPSTARTGGNRRRAGFFPRTQASMRRARQRARSDEWQGAWGQITGRIWDILEIDLDLHDEEGLEDYRTSQRMHELELREFQRWQQRLNIARENGAQDVFARNIPHALLQHQQVSHARQPPQPPAEETREERRAWGALDRARESEAASPSSRKRKSRSVTASPAEPAPEPERRLKRPRTRRIGAPSNASSAGESASQAPSRMSRNGAPVAAAPTARSPGHNEEAPSFLSSLLREVEMSTPSDDENIRCLFGDNRPAVDPSSPGSSPAASAHNSPRALSTTPPPMRSVRPSSPTSLSSHIEPIYPPANYSPTRKPGEPSDPEQRQTNGAGPSELRQPRPRRQQPLVLRRSPDSSPTRPNLSLETKENISNIVRSVLKPHWKGSQLTADQYAAINRDVSRKLYEEVIDPAAIDEDARRTWEKRAEKEVAQAIAELKS